jgi:hypothetical protein
MKTVQIDDELFDVAKWFAQILSLPVQEVIDQILRKSLFDSFKSQAVQALELACQQEYDTFALAHQVAQRLEAEVAEMHLMHAEKLVDTPDVGLIDVQPVDPNGPDISGFGWMLSVHELQDGKWQITERH